MKAAFDARKILYKDNFKFDNDSGLPLVTSARHGGKLISMTNIRNQILEHLYAQLKLTIGFVADGSTPSGTHYYMFGNDAITYWL
jgi:hypothetical protein